MAKQLLSTCLWFDNQAEEAVQFYCSIFRNSKITKTSYYSKEGYDIHKMPEGTVMAMEFELDGSPFMALNGGPIFKFTEAISIVINCKDQEEVDYYWNKLKEGGDPNAQVCGWLKDKYGLSWQVVPEILGIYMSDEDRVKADKVTAAMLKMKKIDVAELERAYAG